VKPRERQSFDRICSKRSGSASTHAPQRASSGEPSWLTLLKNTVLARSILRERLRALALLLVGAGIGDGRGHLTGHQVPGVRYSQADGFSSSLAVRSRHST
jgi:hypothetical protein